MENANSRTRTFGDVTVTFRDVKAAEDFDAWLDSTFTLYVDGEAVDSYRVGDRFDPYEFFGIRKDDDSEDDD